MAFLRKQMKNIHFSRGLKKTKNAPPISKIILRLWKSRTKEIKYYLKMKKNWPKKSKFKFFVSQIIAIFGRLGILP